MGRKKKVEDSSNPDFEHKPKKKKMTAREREELLIENFVGLQGAMTNLSIRFERLSDHILKLLQVFEEAAKNYIEPQGSKTADEDVLKKIDSLLEQNKTIAKGLVLIEEKVRNKVENHTTSTEEKPREKPKPLPKI